MSKTKGILIAAMALAGCWQKADNTANNNGAPDNTTTTVASTPLAPMARMDDLLEQLAQRAGARVGSSSDFKIIVTTAAYPIGTLMREGTTIPVDYSACQASSQPPQAAMPSLFPNYSIAQSVAVDFGLDRTLLDGIASAGAGIDASRGVNLIFSEPHLSTLSDADMKGISHLPACAAQIATGPMWLVRGYILGRRTFELTTTGSVSANIKFPVVASFDVKAGNGNSVDVADSEDVGYLQIVSELKPDSPATLAVGRPTLSAALLQQTGRVYVQKDAADTSGRDAQVVSALQRASLNVIAHVQSIPSAKVPNVAQVRYFNAGDEPKAQTALAQLRQFYPTATIIRVGLPSPTGQLEVWLAKVGSAANIRPLFIPNPATASKLLGVQTPTVPPARHKFASPAL